MKDSTVIGNATRLDNFIQNAEKIEEVKQE